MAKINFKQVVLSYAAGTSASVTTGWVLASLWDHYGGRPDYPTLVGGAWLMTVGIPSCLLAADSIREAFGERRNSVSVSSGPSSVLGRMVPINYSSGTKHTFLSSLPMGQDQPEVSTPKSFTVTMDGNDHTIVSNDLDSFLHTAWRLQRQKRHGLSRKYWTRQHRPRYHRLEYDAIIFILLSVEGLIVDRGDRRSGRLTLPPKLALNVIKNTLG